MPRATQPSFDFGREPVDDEPTLTVSELGQRINQTFRATFGSSLWVRGEIQSWSVKGPHAYFTLSDDTPGRSAHLQVRFFERARQRLAGLLQQHDLRLGDGVKVRICGSLDFYAPHGSVGLKLENIDPRFTLGDLAAQRAAVLRKLAADGTLAANRRLPLPALPLRVGVVTSVGSAAWHDFRHELELAGFGFHLVVADTIVQGPNAARAIARAIRSVAHHATVAGLDCIVVVRGGGARNELAAFDGEPVARAIAAAPVPVLTGIGHEVDRSIADEAAHTAFKTPTACAGFLVDQVTTQQQRVDEVWATIAQLAARRIDERQRHLDSAAQRIAARAVDTWHRADERVGHAARRVADRVEHCVRHADVRLAANAHRLSDRVEAQLRLADQRLATAGSRLAVRPPQLFDGEGRRLDSLEARVRALDPVHVMRRGWCITRTAGGSIVRSVDDVDLGDELVTLLPDGNVTSTVSAPRQGTAR